MKESQEKNLRQYVSLLFEIGPGSQMAGPEGSGGSGLPAGMIDQYTEIMGYPLHAWKKVITDRSDREFIIAGQSLNQGGPERHEKEARAEWDSCYRCDLLWSQMSHLTSKYRRGARDSLDPQKRGGPYEEALRRKHVPEFDKEWDRFWSSSAVEVAVELADPTGVTGWDDVRPSWDNYVAAKGRADREYQQNGLTIQYAGFTGDSWISQIIFLLTLLSLIPVLGKVGKLSKVPKFLPIQKIRTWLADSKITKLLRRWKPKKDIDYVTDVIDDIAETGGRNLDELVPPGGVTIKASRVGLDVDDKLLATFPSGARVIQRPNGDRFLVGLGKSPTIRPWDETIPPELLHKPGRVVKFGQMSDLFGEARLAAKTGDYTFWKLLFGSDPQKMVLPRKGGKRWTKFVDKYGVDPAEFHMHMSKFKDRKLYKSIRPAI